MNIQIMSYKEFHPPHIYKNETIYFISSRTINKDRFFEKNFEKDILWLVLRKAINKFKIGLFAWVLLDNHYHLLFKIQDGKNLLRFIHFINGKSSFLLNQAEMRRGRKIWCQYWDKCIRDEVDFWKHFNYIHHNPIKHSLVKNKNELENYKFCSYRNWLSKKSKEWLDSCFEFYPIIDFTLDDD